MDKESPIIGYHSSGQYVIIKGQGQVDKLKLLGNYGNNLDHGKKKDALRRGPLDRQLAQIGPEESNEDLKVYLTLQEAFFLAYALGALNVVSEVEPEIVYSLGDCWSRFRSYYSKSNNNSDFATDYGVYHYLQSRGWIVKPGDNYGTNYILYKEGPSIDHAQYAALIINSQDTSRSYSWESLLTFYRVIQSVSKELLLIYVSMSRGDNVPNYSHPSCIRSMKITTQVFTASPTIPAL